MSDDKFKRVYHPTLSTFQDVPTGDADAWKDAGWRFTPHKGTDEADAHPVGEHPGHAQVPVLEDTTPTTTPTTTTSAPAKASA